MKKAIKPKVGTPKTNVTTTYEELKTDFPLSEKDQFKQAEEKMRKKTRS
jgi:hypothetical protein